MDIHMEELLQATIDEGGSDLHIRAYMPPKLRVHGELLPLSDEPLSEEDSAALVREISDDEQMAELEKNGGADFALAHPDGTRFRVSVFKERKRYSAVLRQIPNTLMTMEQLGLPPVVKELLFKPRGLILVTGPTGSGKSTTLASMIDVINQERNVHIVTIEDPIEFYHNSKNSLVTQREVGDDVPTFAEAIRRALRQDPDVILVGEMRDLETIAAAITAAETGHLVFGTLHTTGAAETIDRIVDAFPMNQQAQIRTQLAAGLQAVISQILLPRLGQDGQVHGRVAAFEIMTTTDAIRSRIRDNKTNMIKSDMQTGAKFGMTTLDTSLTNLFKQGLIAYEELITKSQDPDSVVTKLREEGYGS
ncbi:MAG: PilT/PilU family type 4a pilus ATPase [Kiritimatiellae bacterium]|nr:PilT/PilU family type 4a pilus ATPase [Kiritimatiellia bacterium]MBQ6330899.1 PilT/PilU family type 4a pilus ATPase [Kiritimatiellia bacterium]